MSLMSVVFVYLAVVCAVIKGQGIGYAEHTFDDVGVEIIIQINANQVNIEICGNSDSWFGVGFNGALMMDVTDALIITNDGSTATVKEYNLNDHALGDLHPVPQYTLTDPDALFSNDELCVFVERSTTVTATGYFDFPTTFATDTQSHHDIIVARGGSTTISKHSVTASTTLFYQEGIRTTATPTAVPTEDPTEAPTESELITKESTNADSAICFASDSYVLTYPDFKRALVKDLKIYDKMLTYDELEGTFFWDELLVKIHFEEGEFLNDVLVEMREFVLSNGERLTMSHNHLLFVGQSGLQRADHVRLGDKLKVFDGSYADVIGIEESVKRYGRNLITYNGNLVINGVAISTFTESIWGESPSWGKWLRHVMKYGYSYDVWRMPAYWTAKVWTDYASVGFKDTVLRFYFDGENKHQIKYSNFIAKYRATKSSDGYATEYRQHKKWCRGEDWEANEIIEGFLWLGGIKSAKSVYKLYELGISYVLNCAEPNFIKYDKTSFKHCCLHAKDKNGYNLIDAHLDDAIAFIEEARSNSAKILIHCIGGVNRSASIVVGYLLYLENQHSDPSIINATQVVLDQRSFALTNRSFQHQLLDYEHSLNKKRSKAKRVELHKKKAMIKVYKQ